MSIGRRSFLKSATMTSLSAGLALGSAYLVFGQDAKKGRTQPAQPARPTKPVTEIDTGGGFPIPIEAQQEALFYFRPSTFTPYVGGFFQAPNARGEMITLKLIAVSEYKMQATTRLSTRKTRQTESFSLTFSSTERLPLFTSIHKVSHPALGEFDLFLTSSETVNGTFLSEAVFNHLQ